MKILILQPEKNTLKYCLLNKNEGILVKGKIETYRDNLEETPNLFEIKAKLYEKSILQDRDLSPECIVIRSLFGGKEFYKPEIVNEFVIDKLKKLVSLAPLHIPAIINLCENAPKVFEGIKVIVVFDTAFFFSLPEPEKNYAIDIHTLKKMGVFRTGYKGIFHEAAAKQAALYFKENMIKKPAKNTFYLSGTTT